MLPQSTSHLAQNIFNSRKKHLSAKFSHAVSLPAQAQLSPSLRRHRDHLIDSLRQCSAVA